MGEPIGVEQAALPPDKDCFRSLEELTFQFDQLIKAGWRRQSVHRFSQDGSSESEETFVYISPYCGQNPEQQTLWVIAGVHGTEKAPPNAIASEIDFIITAGQRFSLVLLPLQNPIAYRSDTYCMEVDGHPASVNDAQSFLAVSRDGLLNQGREETNQLIGELLRLQELYPPRLVIDLHEDDALLLDTPHKAGYVFYYGGNKNIGLAGMTLGMMEDCGWEPVGNGTTDVGETINDGLIRENHDGSVDELLSLESYADPATGDRRNKPATTVLVVETAIYDQATTPVADRIEVHRNLIRGLDRLWAYVANRDSGDTLSGTGVAG